MKDISRIKVKSESKEIIIYFLIAYGINFLFGIPLIFNEYIDFNVFAGLIVLLPANGAFIAKVYRDKNFAKNRIFMIMFVLLIVYTLLIALKVGGVINNNLVLLITSIFNIVCSIGIIASKWVEKNNKGLFFNFEMVHKDIFMFLILLIIKSISYLVIYSRGNDQSIFGLIAGIVGIPFMFIINAVAFFGEECGWREYLQEKLQKKFGSRKGVILLGVLWELWHVPLWFSLYNIELWQIFIRIALSISMAVFLGYLYMKTHNVCICALAHCINNSIAGTIGNTLVIENENRLFYTVIIIIFCLFMFSYINRKEYSIKE